MPNRTFRITIENNSSAELVFDAMSTPEAPSVNNGPLLLKQSFNHLCQGQWTEGNWAPPPTIAAGTSGSLQAESNGFMGATEGYVKYDVLANDGMTKVGMIYLYWSNPFFGTTTYVPGDAFTDIYPNCDYDTKKKGVSTTTGTENLPFTFGVVEKGEDGTDPALASPGDYLVYATAVPYPWLGMVAGVVDLFGTAGITAHPELWLALNDAPLTTGAPQVFGISPQTFLKLLTNATHRQWIGPWGTGEISVTITQPPGGATLTAAVYDGTTNPALSFTQTITPGPAGLLDSAAGWVHKLVEEAPSPAQRVAFTNAATQVIKEAAQAQAVHSLRRTQDRSAHFRSLVGSHHTETATAATAAVAGALAKMLEAEGAVAYLGNNVVLSLYGVFEANGTQIGTQLQYQRFTATGNPVSNAMLSPTQYIG